LNLAAALSEAADIDLQRPAAALAGYAYAVRLRILPEAFL
jgi:hypothetical protein